MDFFHSCYNMISHSAWDIVEREVGIVFPFWQVRAADAQGNLTDLSKVTYTDTGRLGALSFSARPSVAVRPLQIHIHFLFCFLPTRTLL